MKYRHICWQLDVAGLRCWSWLTTCQVSACVCVCVRLPVFQSVCLPTHVPNCFCMEQWVSACLSVSFSLSACLPICLCFCMEQWVMSVCLPTHLPMFLYGTMSSVCLPAYPSAYLFLYGTMRCCFASLAIWMLTHPWCTERQGLIFHSLDVWAYNTCMCIKHATIAWSNCAI